MEVSAAEDVRTAEVCGALILPRSDGLSALQDEVLSHRLGLVPVRVDPDLFECKSGWHASVTQISSSVSISDRREIQAE